MKTLLDFLSLYDKFLITGISLFVLCVFTYYLHENAIKASSNLLIHRFVLKPNYVRGLNGTIQYVSGVELAIKYGLEDDDFIVADKEYKFQPTDIVLPVLEQGGYIDFKEESVRWFYARQEAYAENYAFQQ